MASGAGGSGQQPADSTQAGTAAPQQQAPRQQQRRLSKNEAEGRSKAKELREAARMEADAAWATLSAEASSPEAAAFQGDNSAYLAVRVSGSTAGEAQALAYLFRQQWLTDALRELDIDPVFVMQTPVKEIGYLRTCRWCSWVVLMLPPMAIYLSRAQQQKAQKVRMVRLMGAAHNGFLRFKADNVLGALVRGIAERYHVSAALSMSSRHIWHGL